MQQNKSERETILAAAHISKSFRKHSEAVRALMDVSFSLADGQSLGIVGESGAGKSTLLNIILGLEHPDSGTVFYRGAPLDFHSHRQMADFHREVQAVFQDPKSSLDPRMRVESIIEEPLWALHIACNYRQRVAAVLESVGLDPGTANRYPHEFSGGQRQRIAIARALAPHPRILVADEPLSALDVSVRMQILELLQELKRQLSLSIILVSHDLTIVAQLCEQTIVIRSGTVVESSPTRSMFMNPQNEYTKRLISAIPHLSRIGI